MIQLKRVYESPGPHDGARFLVDRLWPRGLSKADVHVDGWQNEAGPSDRLRKWFSHDPRKWTEVLRRYFAELEDNPEAWEPIRNTARRAPVRLLYSSHDEEQNNAVALKRFLEAKLAHKKATISQIRIKGRQTHV